MSDSDLVHRARRGDSTALAEIVNRYAKQLHGIAYSLLANSADAEDAVQETFLGAVAGLAKFEQRASLKPWLIRILVHQVSKIRRSRSMRLHEPVTEATASAPGQS